MAVAPKYRGSFLKTIYKKEEVEEKLRLSEAACLVWIGFICPLRGC